MAPLLFQVSLFQDPVIISLHPYPLHFVGWPTPPCLPGTLPVLAVKVPHPRKFLSSMQSRTIGHPKDLLLYRVLPNLRPCPWLLFVKQLCFPLSSYSIIFRLWIAKFLPRVVLHVTISPSLPEDSGTFSYQTSPAVFLITTGFGDHIFSF